MPFRLNNALLEFQHRIDEIYKLILDFFLVYIDDALIFSNNKKEHVEHLFKFKELTYINCLALSESIMKIALKEIGFSELHMKDGNIAKKIYQFPNELSSRKQIQ